MPLPQLVLDCSVTMAWCFDDEQDSYAQDVLARLPAASAVVPAIWSLEVLNVLLVGERRARITPARSARFLVLLAHLPIDVAGDPPSVVVGGDLSGAMAPGLSSYDAA